MQDKDSNMHKRVTAGTGASLTILLLLAPAAFAETPGDGGGDGSGNVIQIESMGARAFGGTTIPMPDSPSADDPTNFQACDHGFTEWFIPPDARQHAMVLVHGSSTRTYQTTFDGQPGFQTILLRQGFPVYLVDLPWTGRAGKACDEYTWNPVNETFSARFVFTNRVGTWPEDTPASQKEFFPGVAFTQDPEELDQYFRNQYVEFNEPHNVERESRALAVLLEEVYEEHGAGAILHTHSSSHARGLLAPRLTDKVAGQIGWEPSADPVFPEGELPPPIPRADGEEIPAGTEIPLEEFLKLTRHPILLIWGDYIAQELDPENGATPPETRRIRLEQYRLFAEVANKHGGDVTNLVLPEAGITGNTHYPQADTNITEVAEIVNGWLEEKGLNK